MVFNLNQIQEMLALLALIYQKQNTTTTTKKCILQLRRDSFDYIIDHLNTHGPAGKSASNWNKIFKGRPTDISESNKTILIRKYDLNQYLSLSNAAKPRPLAKMLDHQQK